MKRLLPLLLSCFLLFEGTAQNASEEKQRSKVLEDYYKRFYNQPTVGVTKDSNIVLNNLAFLKGKKPGVYRLPQDNMPCIVPDSSKTVRIPNAWKGPVRTPYRSNPPRMPNAGKWVPFPIANENSNTNTK